jgi:3-(3-hydroxy-phenyl)propionate hydroxylase
VLDDYTPERRPQVRAVIDASIAMGQVVCISDKEEAARRDEAYLAGNVPPLPPFPGLTDGLICKDPAFASESVAGLLSVHGQVTNLGEASRYDDAVPNGFHIIALDAHPNRHLDAQGKAALAAIGGRSTGITTDADKAVKDRVLLDVSGKYKQFFDEHGVKAIVVRPDYYIFGGVQTLEELPALLSDLVSRLSIDENAAVVLP